MPRGRRTLCVFMRLWLRLTFVGDIRPSGAEVADQCGQGAISAPCYSRPNRRGPSVTNSLSALSSSGDSPNRESANTRRTVRACS